MPYASPASLNLSSEALSPGFLSGWCFTAALLLILPGFATDFLGLLIIFPPTRKLIFKKVSIKKKPINKKQDFINGEFEDIEDENDRKL